MSDDVVRVTSGPRGYWLDVGGDVITSYAHESEAFTAADAIRRAIADARNASVADLLTYGCHTAACDHLMTDPTGCSCGWKDLRNELKGRNDDE